MSWFTKLTGIALMAVALPTSLSAQQHQHVQRDSTRQGMMHGPMSGAMPMGGTNMGSMMEGSEMMLSMIGMSPRIMRLQPNQVLRHVEELALSEDQIAQIEHIAEEQRDAHAGHMSSMTERTERMGRLLENDHVSDQEIQDLIDGSVEFFRDMHSRMIVDALAVRELLSVTQRDAALSLPLDPSAMMMHDGDMMVPREGAHNHNKP